MFSDKPFVLLFVLLFFGAASYSYAQPPAIAPKPQPVKLRLDPNGYYKVDPADIAVVTNKTDSATQYVIRPPSFDCDTKGLNKVDLTAFSNGTTGDRNPTNVGFIGPLGITVDPKGNIYVAENFAAVVRKITPDGTVSTFAGNGMSSYADGVGTKASFGSPQGITCDSLGNIYLLDGGFPGVGTAPSLRKITPDGVVKTLVYGKFMKYPFGITIDKKGNLYITDRDSYVVFKYTPDGIESVVAGSGQSGYIDGTLRYGSFTRPDGIAVDDAGNIYVADDLERVIRKVTPDGTISTFAGTGRSKLPGDPDVNAFSSPTDIKISKSGYFYVFDYNEIVRISPDGKKKDIIATDPRLNGYFMTFDQCENLYYANIDKNNIGKISPSGEVSVLAGTIYQIEQNGNVGPFSCQIARDTIDVNVQSTPKITTPFPDLTVVGCANLANYIIKAAATDNCPDSGIKFTQSPAPNSILTNDKPVVVTITATDTTGGTDTKSFTVTDQYTAPPPGSSVSINASATKICLGQPVTFNAAVINGDTGTSYQWLVNGINTGPDNAEFTTSDLKDGDMVNCAVTTANGCGVPNVGLDLPINVEAYPTIALNPAEQIISGSGVQLKPTFTGNVTKYSWTPTAGLDDPGSPNPTASPLVTTAYQLKATTGLGCDATASVTVTVINQIKIPNTFTPNADGINDVWEIPFLSNYANCVVNIYNRYGVLAFHSIGYGKPWNGTYNGKQVPVGEYYYIVDLKDGTAPRSGNLTVLR